MMRAVLFLLALLAAAPAAAQGGPDPFQDPEGRAEIARLLVARFIDEKVGDYNAKTAELRKEIDALNCPAPPAPFGADGLPGPSTVTVVVDRKIEAPPPVAPGSNLILEGSIRYIMSNRNDLGVDGFDGDMLTLPTAAPFRITASTVKIKSETCRNTEGKVLGRRDNVTVTRNVDITRVAVAGGSIQLDPSGQNVEIDRANFTLRAAGQGEVRTPTLRATNLVRIESGPCGFGSSVSTKGTQLIRGARIGRGFEVTDLQLRARLENSANLSAGEAVDLFFGEDVSFSEPTFIQIEPGLVVNDGREAPNTAFRRVNSASGPTGRFRATIAGGGPFAFERRGDILLIRRIASAIGEANVTYAPVGRAGLSRNLRVTSSRVRFEAGPNVNTRATAAGDVPMASQRLDGEAFGSFVIEGPADVSKLKTAFELEQFTGPRTASRSLEKGAPAFEGDTARFDFDMPKDIVAELVRKEAIDSFDRRRPRFDLSGELSASADVGGRRIAAKTGTIHALAPTAQSLRLFGGRRGVEGAGGGVAFDLFRGSVTPQVIDLGYELNFEGGISGPTNLVKAIGIQQDAAALLAIDVNGITPVDGAAVGEAQVRAFLTPSAADRRFIPLAGEPPQSLVSNSLSFTVNNVTYIIEPGNTFTHRIVVRGPADMRRYTAVFNSTEGVRRNGFQIEALGSAQSQATYSGRTIVNSVDLVDAGGQVVASFQRGQTPTAAPSVRLHTPNAYIQGEVYDLFGTVSNMSDKIARTSICQWTLEPGFGRFLRAFTPVTVLDETHAECAGAVIMDERKETVGEFPFVELQVLFGLPPESIVSLTAGEGDG